VTDLSVPDEHKVPADLSKTDIRVNTAWNRASAMHAQSLYLETIAYEIGVHDGGVRGIERGTEKEQCARRKEQFAALAESRSAAKEAREWSRFARDMDEAQDAGVPGDVEESDVLKRHRETMTRMAKESSA